MKNAREAQTERGEKRDASELVFRVLVIVLGMGSAITLARNELHIGLNQYFDAVVEFYDSKFKDVTFVVVDLLRTWLRIDLNLLPHWKHVFAVLWLLLGSLARNRLEIVPPIDANNAPPRTLRMHWLWGGVSALIAGLIAGTLPGDGDGVFWCAVFGLLLYWVGLYLWHRWWRRHWLTARFGADLARLGIFAAIGFVIGHAVATPAAGLVSIGATTFIYAAWYIVRGASYWDRDEAFIGIDILFVLSGAFLFLLVGHALA